MLVVTDVRVSASSTVVVMSEALALDSDWEVVEPQSFLSPESAEPFVWRIKKT